MTASPVQTGTSFTSPVVDYEPPPVGAPALGPCHPPSPAALRRHTPRRRRPAHAPSRIDEPLPPRAAAIFADTALRRILEVADRRRPMAQLRPVLAPALFDAVTTLTRSAGREGPAVLRRVRLRAAGCVDGETAAAEVFATYTRGPRVRVIAGRVELVDGRWVVVALQIG